MYPKGGSSVLLSLHCIDLDMDSLDMLTEETSLRVYWPLCSSCEGLLNKSSAAPLNIKESLSEEVYEINTQMFNATVFISYTSSLSYSSILRSGIIVPTGKSSGILSMFLLFTVGINGYWGLKKFESGVCSCIVYSVC